MRMHIVVEDDLVAELDRLVGRGGRSRFVAEALRQRLADERRWESLESAFGTISDVDHVWDPDPGAWVRDERQADPRRTG